jgi:hypothetical protein
MAQDVAFSTTSIAQAWTTKTPGFSDTTQVPLTEFVGVDATKLGGKEALSFHMYGWGMADLGDQSYIGGKHTGDLTYGYLQYDFKQANAQIKAGRIIVNQGLGPMALDGVEARTDLRYGFMVSAFAGTPVVFKNYSNNNQYFVAYQQDISFGGRFAWRTAKLGEIGVSYLQDGSHPAAGLTVPQPVDYTRKQLAADVKLDPCAFLDVAGRTVLNVASDQITVPGTDPSRIAEHDYKATAKVNEKISITGTYVERNFFSYYAGSTLPSLFNQDEQGTFKATGASLVWAALANLQIVGDVRRSERTSYGDATRAGGEARYTFTNAHVVAGAAYHQVNADDVLPVNAQFAAYSLSHSEERVWVMADRGAYSASLDMIRLHYDDADANPNLHGQSIESAIVGSLGYKAKDNLRLSADLSVEDNALTKSQVMALLRVQYTFGLAAKGGK